VRIRDKITQVLGTGFIEHTEAREWRSESVTIHLDQALTLLPDDAQKLRAPVLAVLICHLRSSGPRKGISFSFPEVLGQASSIPRPP
jgi:hypothetical protein